MTDSLSDLRVKVCGLTREEDATRAAELGAAFLGFVFAQSPRRADPARLAEWLPRFRRENPGVLVVGVFVRPVPPTLPGIVSALALDLVQVHERPGEASPPGMNESFPVPWIRAAHPHELPSVEAPPGPGPGSVRGTPPYAWLVDTPSTTVSGGTGRAFDWSLLPAGPRRYRLFLAGGLSPENVAAAVSRVRPFAVDASSRLESEPGAKDHGRLEDFFSTIRSVARVVPAGVG